MTSKRHNLIVIAICLVAIASLLMQKGINNRSRKRLEEQIQQFQEQQMLAYKDRQEQISKQKDSLATIIVTKTVTINRLKYELRKTLNQQKKINKKYEKNKQDINAITSSDSLQRLFTERYSRQHKN